jgi:hypothetical protein
MMMLLVIVCVYQALCLFLLAMPKYTKVLGREFKPSERQSQMRRIGASALLGVGMYLASVELGVVNALVFMCGALTLVGICIALLFQYFPAQALRPVIPAGKTLGRHSYLFLAVQLACMMLLT